MPGFVCERLGPAPLTPIAAESRGHARPLGQVSRPRATPFGALESPAVEFGTRSQAFEIILVFRVRLRRGANRTGIESLPP
jgi:hypothetical protein